MALTRHLCTPVPASTTMKAGSNTQARQRTKKRKLLCTLARRQTAKSSLWRNQLLRPRRNHPLLSLKLYTRLRRQETCHCFKSYLESSCQNTTSRPLSSQTMQALAQV